MSVLPLVSIGDLVDPVSSWTPERDDPDGVFTYIDLSAVDQETKVIIGARELACAEAPSRARQLVRVGDVLVSTVRPNLNGVARVPPEFDGATASTGFTVLRPRKESLDSDYLFQWVKSSRFVSDMVRRATGASYPAVSDRIVCDSKLPLPPLHEQRRIADILDKTDVLRMKRHTAIAQLNTLTQSIFLDMFGDPRRKGSTGKSETAPYKLGELTRIRTGKLDANAANENGLYPFFTCSVDPLRINTAAFNCKAVLVAGNGDLNVKYYEGQFNAYQRTYVIESIDESVLVPKFLYAFLDLYISELRRQAIGGVIKYIKLPYLTEAVVQLPLVEAQRKFAKCLEAAKELATAQHTAEKGFSSLVSSFQYRAFSGEL